MKKVIILILTIGIALYVISGHEELGRVIESNSLLSKLSIKNHFVSKNDDETVAAQLNSINLNKDIYSEYYIDRVTSFMSSNSGKGKIVFLGDSLIDICEWSELLNNEDIINRGISFDTTDGVLNRLGEVTRLKPRKIFIMVGINDIGKGRDTKLIAENYKKILDYISQNSPATTIYVQSVLPINKDIFKTNTKYEEVRYLNQALNNLCNRYEIDFINLYPLFVIENNKLNPEYTVRGLHLNGKGYLVWKKAIKEYCK